LEFYTTKYAERWGKLNQEIGTTENTESTEEPCPYYLFPCLRAFRGLYSRLEYKQLNN